MADVYFEDETPRIQYRELAAQLFDTSRRQTLIPFLGAGASLSDVPSMTTAASPGPSTDQVDDACAALGLRTPGARLMVEIASRIAYHLEASASGATTPRPDPLSRLASTTWPPSAGELAEVFAHLSEYEPFEDALDRVALLLNTAAGDRAQVRHTLEALASVTGLASTTAPLLAVSSYFEYTFARKRLADTLRKIFAGKTTPTRLHRLLAKAAHSFMANKPLADYLLITTNYDCLMEAALEETRAPYCVLTVDRQDRKVYTRFGATVRDYLGLNAREYADLQGRHQGQKFPSQFSFEKASPLVVVYKIHGCLHADLSIDSVVISDDDYVDYIYRMADNQGAVPAPITSLLEDRAFLFLGYRFADWNVRTIYRRVIERRSAADSVRDFAVMRQLSAYEQGFFGQRRINVLKTDLARFVQGIERHLP